ncbi:unnamed protein product, partial [Rotaria sp. Silwood1]
TCLLNQYVDGQYNESLAPTVGIDIRNKTFEYESSRANKVFTIHLQLWDTAGQERFRSLTSSFFREAIGFLLVFDLTNEASFIHARDWIGEIQTNAYAEHAMILVGNKCDLENERLISKDRAQDFAKEYNIKYIETSALKNINVTESVKLLLDTVMERFEHDKNRSKSNQSIISSLNDNKINPSLTERIAERSKITMCCSY